MDYNALLDLTVDLGYRLASNGAETFRVEESINRILAAYKIEAEVFAIPNCLIVSIETDQGKLITRMRRIKNIDTNLSAVETYNALSRRICAEIPNPELAIQWLKEADNASCSYRTYFIFISHFIAAFGFCIFFGGTIMESICSGVCGLLIGIITLFMTKLHVNRFFSTIACSFIMAAAAYTMRVMNFYSNTDTVIIGALMILVPGLLFTNAMRDIIFGDTNSGVNRIVQVLLIAAAIALGTGVAWNLINTFRVVPDSTASVSYSYLMQCIASVIGCAGFAVIYNIHGKGTILCILGGGIVWAAYCVTLHFSDDAILANFIAAIVSAVYSETMARIRKCPAIAYLVVSLFPLLPGAGIYYTAASLVRSDMDSFVNNATTTIAIAGALAVGVLLVSTSMRFRTSWLQHMKK